MHPFVTEYLLNAKKKLLAIRFVKTQEELATAGDPSSPRAQYLFARLTFWKGEPRAALDILDGLIPESKSPDPLVLKARYLEHKKKYKDALSLMAEAGQMDPKSQRIWLNTARLLRKMGMRDKALQAAKTAVNLNQKNPVAWYETGRAYYSNSNTEKAIRALGVAIKLNPDFYKAYQALANIAVAEGRLKELIPVFEFGLQHNPNSLPLRYMLSQMCADEKNYNRAAYHSFEMVKRTGYYSDYFRLGIFALADGKQEQALYAIKEAFKRNPEAVGADLLQAFQPGSPEHSQLTQIMDQIRAS